MQPKVYISCQPDKQGAVFGLFYCATGVDIMGWHIEARDGYFSAGFFLLENFYTEHAVRLYRSIEDDVHGRWVIDHPPMQEPVRSPVPDELAHELERLQSLFVEDWLFFEDDGLHTTERAEYDRLHLPVHQVNIRARRLCRLVRTGSELAYAQPGVDFNIVHLLRKYWRLSEKIPVP